MICETLGFLQKIAVYNETDVSVMQVEKDSPSNSIVISSISIVCISEIWFSAWISMWKIKKTIFHCQTGIETALFS